ncbi:hypothetical protein ACHAW5_004523 [Stephanodiscus triporus]|uniref:Uncharacterized protein n=1 Tax=Stephanodiscus triporus TaxID=2934178 RepID=A0ABD3P1D6_9STRA
MSIKPFHSLFLERDASRQHKSKTPSHDERADDYLSKRSEFREKISSQRRAENVEVVSAADCGDAKDMITNLRKAASKLEIAMTVCCERVAYRADDSGHRSRIIPVFPANYVVPEKSKSSKDPPNKNSKPTATNLGILRSGKSMHFLKLLVMNCPRHEVAHRALAVAILQRTVEWEISSIGHPQLKTSSFDLFSFTGDEQLIQNTIGLLNTDLKESFTMHAKRTKSFLAAGGMKLLARWLLDSFTVVSAPSSNHKSPVAQHIASPTGCLLLPILHLLKFIPFDKSLVVESQIHKSIKRLKKLLTVLVEELDPNSLEEVVHPIAGGLSVGKVIASIDTVMTIWKKAAAVESIADSSLKFDSFDQLQKRVQRRFDYLEKMQNEVGNPPMWLPKSMLGAWRATPSNMEKIIDAPHPLPPSSKSMDQGLSIKKRAGSPTFLEVSKQFKKQVSWAE